MKDLKELTEENKRFKDTGFENFPEAAQKQVITYMRGLKDGMEITKKEKARELAAL